MRHEDEPLDPIDQALRSPGWEPPLGFARRIVAAAYHEQRTQRDWQPWLQALERGALAGVGAYATAVVWQVSAPAVMMNPTVVGWVAATLALAWAGYVSRSLFSRI
jgi:hypothetical protein